jgi:hypothetical protein
LSWSELALSKQHHYVVHSSLIGIDPEGTGSRGHNLLATSLRFVAGRSESKTSRRLEDAGSSRRRDAESFAHGKPLSNLG